MGTKAAAALGNLRDRAHVEPLLDVLKAERSTTRSAAAEALGKIGDPRAVEPLIRLLQREQLEVYSVAMALGKFDDPRVIPTLSDMMKHKKTKHRKAATWALGIVRSSDAIPGLIEALRDQDHYVRNAAEQSLIKRPEAQVDQLLRQLVGGDDTGLSEIAARILASRDSP